MSPRAGGMAKLVEALDLGSSGEIRVGSSPTTPTKNLDNEALHVRAFFVSVVR